MLAVRHVKKDALKSIFRCFKKIFSFCDELQTRDEMHDFPGFSKKFVTKRACFVTKFFDLFRTIKKYAEKILTYKSRYDRILVTEDNMIS